MSLEKSEIQSWSHDRRTAELQTRIAMLPELERACENAQRRERSKSFDLDSPSHKEYHRKEYNQAYEEMLDTCSKLNTCKREIDLIRQT